jgi:hypothetical protein
MIKQNNQIQKSPRASSAPTAASCVPKLGDFIITSSKAPQTHLTLFLKSGPFLRLKENRNMLGYKCPKCGRTKYADGKGCSCGESWAVLRVVRLDKNGNEEKPYQEKDKGE